jgi:predicted aconitase with swiveling domain
VVTNQPTGDATVGETARGSVLRLDRPLSFWGGVDPATGRVIDVHHPQHGAVVTDRVLVMPHASGSSSSSSVLLECVRLGTAPAALVMRAVDPILPVGAAVARELYGRGPVVVRLDDLEPLRDGVIASIAPDGAVTVVNPSPGGRQP